MSELNKPKTPRRRYQLELNVGADSKEDLIGFLRSFQTELYMDRISTGVTGGYSSGGHYKLSIDERITHDSWAEDNERYVEWLEENGK